MTREELINNLKYTMKKHENDGVDTFSTIITLMCKDMLNYLEQEPKTGGWILDIVGCKWMCSECGFIHRFIDGHTAQYNYCPNCGACMKDGRTLDEFIEDSKESESEDENND